MSVYTARIKQSENTINALTQMQYNIYQKKLKLGLVAVSVLLTVAGILLYDKNKAALALTFIGCILFTNLNVYPRYIADRLIKACKGNFPTLIYYFEKDGIKVGTGAKSSGYNKVIYMTDDERYLYIFFTSSFCYIVEKAAVSGENSYEGLKAFLEKKTKLPVKRYSKSVWADLLQYFKRKK